MLKKYLNLIVFIQYLTFISTENLTSVRLVAVKNVGWQVTKTESGLSKFGGIFGDIFNSLTKNFHKKYNFSVIFTKIKGTCKENGTCNGINKKLINGEADFSHFPSIGYNIGPLKLSSSIGESYYDIISFPTPKDLRKSSIINLSLSVWYRILLVIIFCSIFHHKRSNDSWFLAFFKIVRLIINPVKVHEKNFLIICEIFFAFIITNLFFCTLSSCLIHMDSSKLIRTFEQLQDSDKKVFIRYDTFIHTYIITNKKYAKLSKRLIPWKNSFDWSAEWPELLHNSRGHVLVLNNFENTAYAYSFIRFYNLEKYFRSTERLLLRPVFVLISQHAAAKVKNLINFCSYSVLQNGLMEKVVNLHIFHAIGDCYSCEITNIMDLYENVYLTFFNINYLFQAPLITLVLGIITFCCEIFFKTRIKWLQKIKANIVKLMQYQRETKKIKIYI